MKLYNTLSKQTEDFKPMHGQEVKLFVCGPTVYDYSHLGHAKTYIQLDVLARTLRKLGYSVQYLQNITDIDDKIIARANEQDIDWQELTKRCEEAYFEDMTKLGNTSVDQYARATDHIPEIISQVQRLLDSGHAYQTDDGIYFEVATFPEYGKLSGRQEVQENDAQSRIDTSDQKRGWNDFALWKFSKPNEPIWEAPFGGGRPGWHIEDTAITEKYFGPQYDVHGGAVDLIFPHHEAELTQMEALSGQVPFVNYWVHPGFLNIDEAKMSKSLGNFHTIRDVLDKGIDPRAIRLLMLQSNYRSAINFSWESLEAAQNRLKNLLNLAALQWQPITQADNQLDFSQIFQDVLEAMQDDLNTPKALAIISNLASNLEDNLIGKDQLDSLKDLLINLDDIFNLGLAEEIDIREDHKSLIKQREVARAKKDWPKSDQLRDELSAQGLGLRDTEQRTIWFRL
jgi:cysteinyl-tRNA synthetase